AADGGGPFFMSLGPPGTARVSEHFHGPTRLRFDPCSRFFRQGRLPTSRFSRSNEGYVLSAVFDELPFPAVLFLELPHLVSRTHTDHVCQFVMSGFPAEKKCDSLQFRFGMCQH